jgi:hypothetical protein
MAKTKLITTLIGEDRRKALESNLDKVFNAYIMKRDRYSCILTGGQRNTNVSHLFGQSEYPNVRWDERNAHCMVKSVHTHYHESNPFKYIDWFVETYGQEELDDLKKRAYGRLKTYTIGELLDLTNKFVRKTQALPKCRASNGRIVGQING